VAPVRLLHRSLHAFDGYRKIASMPSTGSAPDAAALDNMRQQGETPRCTADSDRRKHWLFHSIANVWMAIRSVRKQVPETKSILEEKFRNFDSTTLPSHPHVTY